MLFEENLNLAIQLDIDFPVPYSPRNRKVVVWKDLMQKNVVL